MNSRMTLGVLLLLSGLIVLFLNFIPYARGPLLSCIAGKEYQQTQYGVPYVYKKKSILPDKCGLDDETHYLSGQEISRSALLHLKKTEIVNSGLIINSVIFLSLVSGGFMLLRKGK